MLLSLFLACLPGPPKNGMPTPCNMDPPADGAQSIECYGDEGRTAILKVQEYDCVTEKPCGVYSAAAWGEKVAVTLGTIEMKFEHGGTPFIFKETVEFELVEPNPLAVALKVNGCTEEEPCYIARLSAKPVDIIVKKTGHDAEEHPVFAPYVPPQP